MKKKADKFKDIEKRSWLYSFIKFVVKFWHNYIFYEKYEIRGIENRPGSICSTCRFVQKQVDSSRTLYFQDSSHFQNARWQRKPERK